MNAERAARRIVSAALAGKPEVILTPAAQLAARGAGIFPSLTARLLHVMATALPAPAPPDPGQAPSGSARGRSLRPAIAEGLFARLTTLGRNAARRLNEP
jgi:hypothetical protein